MLHTLCFLDRIMTLVIPFLSSRVSWCKSWIDCSVLSCLILNSSILVILYCLICICTHKQLPSICFFCIPHHPATATTALGNSGSNFLLTPALHCDRISSPHLSRVSCISDQIMFEIHLIQRPLKNTFERAYGTFVPWLISV